MIPALLTTGLFALAGICATQSAKHFGPLRANLGRLIVAVLLLGLWAHAWGGGHGGGRLGTLVLAGAIGFGAGGWCMFQAFPRLGSTLSLLVVECAAAITATLLAWTFLGAALTGPQIGLGLLILGGVIFALGPYSLPPTTRRQRLAGAGFAALAACGQGLSWTLTKWVFMDLQQAGIRLDQLTVAYQRLLGGLALAATLYLGLALAARLRGRPVPDTPARKAAPRYLLWIPANALAGPVLGVSCMLWAISLVDNPGLVQAVVATATLFTVPLAKRLEDRTFRANYFIGAAISLAAVAAMVIHHR